jgi:hypothetical protein
MGHSMMIAEHMRLLAYSCEQFNSEEYFTQEIDTIFTEVIFIIRKCNRNRILIFNTINIKSPVRLLSHHQR